LENKQGIFKTLTIIMERAIWDGIKKNRNNTSLLVEFDDIISSELQKKGYKCWLRSKSNRFLKNGTWRGIY
jgi:hypothetical protein